MGERIMNDVQLMELHDDIRDGVSMIVSVEHYYHMEADNKRLREALEKYGSHTNHCDSRNKYRKTMGMGVTKGRCDCGFEQALKGPE